MAWDILVELFSNHAAHKLVQLGVDINYSCILDAAK